MMKFFEKNIIGRIVLMVCVLSMMKPYFGGLHCPKGTKKSRLCGRGRKVGEGLPVFYISACYPIFNGFL